MNGIPIVEAHLMAQVIHRAGIEFAIVSQKAGLARDQALFEIIIAAQQAGHSSLAAYAAVMYEEEYARLKQKQN